MSAIESMTSLLWNTTQAKDVAKIPLVTQSAENLGSCLNSLLKAGEAIASGDVGSDLQEKVNICDLALLMAVNCYFIEMHEDTLRSITSTIIIFPQHYLTCIWR